VRAAGVEVGGQRLQVVVQVPLVEQADGARQSDVEPQRGRSVAGREPRLDGRVGVAQRPDEAGLAGVAAAVPVGQPGRAPQDDRVGRPGPLEEDRSHRRHQTSLTSVRLCHGSGGPARRADPGRRPAPA
jgi:hypothetical protein